MANKYEIVRYYSEKIDYWYLEIRKNGDYLTLYPDTPEGLRQAVEHCHKLADVPLPEREVIYSITD